MLGQQFEMASVSGQSAIMDLLVADPFNLGYVFGFADHASNFFLVDDGVEARNEYVLRTLSDLIGDENVGDTLVRYAQRQLKEPVFLRWYRTASKNMKDWLATAGGTTSVGLSDHLEKSIENAHAA
jgi:hypothetical protein